MADRSGRVVQTADSLESRCAAHAPIGPGGRFAVGTVFGDWRVTAFIGRGGNGEVYCAEHVTLGTSAAVKVLTREEDRQLTHSQLTIGGVGTPGYGAPEQMERGEATEASDIHALGVLADQCFGGKPPRAWKRIIERTTSSIPAYRYQSVAALAQAIRRRHWIGHALAGFCCAFALLAAGVALRKSVQKIMETRSSVRNILNTNH